MSSSPLAKQADLARLRRIAVSVAAAVALLWVIQAVLAVTGWSPASLGVRPRDLGGLLGVVTAPLVHGSWGHLTSNTPALLVLRKG